MIPLNFNIRGKLPEKKALQISDIGGVDLSNSPLSVREDRATQISNFIKKNGINEKRNGWEELTQVGTSAINGVHIIRSVESYSTAVDIPVQHIIVHVGTKFYATAISDNAVLVASSKTYASLETAVFTDVGYAEANTGDENDRMYPANQKSFSVVGNDRLYIWAGHTNGTSKGTFNYQFVYRKSTDFTWVLKLVDADIKDTYIPTTTISIPCNDVGSSYVGTTVVATTNEDINIATGWRKNTLIGEPADTTATDFSFTLDANVMSYTDRTFTNMYVYANGSLLTRGTKGTPEDYYLVDDSEDEFYDPNLIVFTANYVPTEEGVPNIEVMFLADYTRNYEIGNCTFGFLYGFDGNKDRVFISGNSKYPNYDWHNRDTENGKYTYFSDLDYQVMGNPNYKVMGYTLLADGTLATIKEESNIEPTVYYRTYRLTPAVDFAGEPIVDVNGAQLYEEAYPMTFGNIGEGMINSYSGLTLGGDSLFLSKNGLFAIESRINTNAIERYSKERSRIVNKELTSYDLSKAACVVFDNKYYIAIGGKCYIADARHKTKLEDDLQDTWEYEYWVWDNIPATYFFIFNSELYFGTAEGHICKFNSSGYQDITKTVLAPGELVVSVAEQTFTISSAKITALEVIDNGDKLFFASSDTKLYCKLLDNDEFSVDGNVITANASIDYEVYRGYAIYVDNIVGTSNLAVATRYYIGNISNDNLSFSLYKYSDDSLVVLQDETFDIRYVMPSETEVVNLQNSDGILKDDCVYDEIEEKWYLLNDDGGYEEEITNDTFNVFETDHRVVEYNGTTPTNVIATLKFYDNVECIWISKWYDLGTTLYSKMIEKLVITPDVLSGSNIQFGYETLRKRSENNIASQINTIDFDYITFDYINFEDDNVARSYIKKIRERDVNFIRFIFKNDTNNNCKINNLTVVYSITRENKGVK